VTLSLSVVSHGHLPLLRLLLADLARQTVAPSLEVLVTLNLSLEDLDPKEFPHLRIRLIRNPSPRGFGANHNAAAQIATGRWFFVVNPDIRISAPDCLEQLVSIAENAPPRTIVAPLITGPAGEPEDSVRSLLTPLSLVRRALGREPLLHPGVTQRQSFFWFAGMFLLLSADHYAELKGFDERYFLYCEDYDLCARAVISRGSLCHAAEISVVHDARRDSHRSLRHLRYHLMSLGKVWLSAGFWRLLLGLHPRTESARGQLR
jgi:N-acetylglucosaminyl-diphospho-decaprenol L-rhamnosyltransferase